MTYKPRLTRPEPGNKYYIRKANGGYSDAILGRPTDSQCNVLSNCVGYAYGRFNEIGGYRCCKYLRPTNAELFIQYAGGLEVGQAPKLGACAVWRGGATQSEGDGAGHVAIVEQIIDDETIVTSESGYGCSNPFWTQKRKRGVGNWGQDPSRYKFLGFIYNPAVPESDQPLPPGVEIKDMLVDGKLCKVRSTMIKGENYVRLRDFQDVMHIATVDYDAAKKLPTIKD